MFSQKGFLLSYVRYGDYDAVLHCFTEEKGFQSFFAKGIYNKKNRKKAYLMPLNELFYFYPKENRSGALQQVSKLEMVENREFYEDVKANAVIFFVSTFLNQILRFEEANNHIYSEIKQFLNHLEQKNYSSHFIFLIKILKNSGVLPLVSSLPYLNPESGTFEAQNNHHLFDNEISTIWKSIIEHENAYELKFPQKIKKNLLDSIFVFYHYHFTDFRIPDSLEIVQQIFEN